ncbi:MAG: hydrolase [Gammaproteobacteria bacterium]|nr:hydrolase [Gammaproteobacteria bacterium]
MKKRKNEYYYEPFEPALSLKYKHFQTIFPSLFRKLAKPEIEIERFELTDGDFVDCYWHHAACTTKKNSHPPIVVLFHGLTGSFKSSYIQGMMHTLNKAGFSSVLMHFRGCSDEMNRLPRSYHSGDTADAKAWIERLQQRYPNRQIFSIGFSLGGNVLLKLLGEWGNSSPLCAAVSISAPLQLDVCATQMNQGFSKFYQYVLLKELKCSLIKKYDVFDMKSMIGIEATEVNNLKSFWDFDDVYTGPIHGFKSAEDYYQQCSSKQYLPAITTKTLIIQALDDPFMSSEILPDQETIPANIQLEIHNSGGHLGFISHHILKPHYWLENHVIDFFKIMSIENNSFSGS